MRTNFTMSDNYICMVRGDTLSFGIQITDDEGKPFTQDLDEASFSCKSNNALNKYVFKKTLGQGITKSGTGEYVVRVAPEDTRNEEAGKYFYDLELKVNGDVFTVLRGVLELTQDITY